MRQQKWRLGGLRGCLVGLLLTGCAAAPPVTTPTAEHLADLGLAPPPLVPVDLSALIVELDAEFDAAQGPAALARSAAADYFIISRNELVRLQVQQGGNAVLLHRDCVDCPWRAVWATHTRLREPPDPPDPPRPPPGDLSRVTAPPGGRFLVDDRGRRVFMRCATLFSAYTFYLDPQRRPQLDETIAVLVREGDINCVRVLLSLAGPFWRGFGTDHRTPGMVEGLPGFAAWLDARGVYLYLDLFGDVRNFGPVPTPQRSDVVSGDTQAIAEMRSYTRDVMDALADCNNCLFSATNEPAQTGWGTDSAVLEDICALMRSRLDRAGWDHASISCGAQGEDEHFFVPSASNGASSFAFHAMRDPRWDYFAALKRYIHGEPDACDLTGRPCVVNDQEGPNQGELDRQGPGNRTDPADGSESVAFSYAAAVTCQVKDIAICTFHWHGGLWSSVPRPATVRALRSWALGLSDVPPCRGPHWNGGHPGTMLTDAAATFNNGSPDDDPTRPLRVHGCSNIGLSLREPRRYVLDVLPNVRTLRRVCDGEWCARSLAR